MTIGLFTIESIVGIIMVEQMQNLLGLFGLLDKMVTFVKDEGENLRTMNTTLGTIVSCNLLNLPAPFLKSRWGHAMLKAMC